MDVALEAHRTGSQPLQCDVGEKIQREAKCAEKCAERLRLRKCGSEQRDDKKLMYQFSLKHTVVEESVLDDAKEEAKK